MSKSSPDAQSKIGLTDSDSEISSKIRGAVTDSIRGVSYDPVNRPGTSNLLTILAACTNEEVTEIARRYESKGHGELKTDVAAAVIEALKGPRREFERLVNERTYLSKVASDGAELARRRSEGTMKEVRRLTGLI